MTPAPATTGAFSFMASCIYCGMFVYCIYPEGRQNLYKFGITNDMPGRVATHQTSNPDAIRVLWCEEVEDRAVARRMEATLLQIGTPTGGGKEWRVVDRRTALNARSFVRRVQRGSVFRPLLKLYARFANQYLP